MHQKFKLIILFLFVIILTACVPPAGQTASSTPQISPTAPLVQTSPTPEAESIAPVALAAFPEHLILYQVNLRAFSPTGDLQGVTNRLDEIQALGANVIYLMPIYPIGKINSVNSPYSVQNYLEVNPEFGSLQDLQTLINEAHRRDMAVILDWVANHTAWDNPWIENEGWYTEKNGKVIQPEGTNWADVADLNYANAAMRAAMIDALKYWVEEIGIDGYRFDAADLVPFDFWQEALTALNAIPERELILLAEGAREDHFAAGFQMNYGWNFYSQLKNVFNGQPATTLYTTHLSDYQNLEEGQDWLRFTTNHDESAWDASPVVLFGGKDGALAASVITLCMGGVPMIYNGQEVGRESTTPFFSKSPITWSQNPEMLAAYQSLLGFYASSTALLEGDLQDCSSADVVCFTRSATGEEVLVLVNVRKKAIDFEVPRQLHNTAWLDAFTNDPAQLEPQTQMPPYAYRVLRREK